MNQEFEIPVGQDNDLSTSQSQSQNNNQNPLFTYVYDIQ